MLCGFPFWGPVPWAMGGWLHPWMWQSGIYENGEDSESITNLEMLIWLWTLCRLYSEVKQVFPSPSPSPSPNPSPSPSPSP
jgi:hypothetical protein